MSRCSELCYQASLEKKREKLETQLFATFLGTYLFFLRRFLFFLSSLQSFSSVWSIYRRKYCRMIYIICKSVTVIHGRRHSSVMVLELVTIDCISLHSKKCYSFSANSFHHTHTHLHCHSHYRITLCAEFLLLPLLLNWQAPISDC